MAFYQDFISEMAFVGLAPSQNKSLLSSSPDAGVAGRTEVPDKIHYRSALIQS